MPIWRSAGRAAGSTLRSRAKASRDHGNGARENVNARPRASSSTLTTFGLKNSAAFLIGCAAVAIAQLGSRARAAATSAITLGSISGSSPCTFTTTVSAASASREQASARRSVPVACCGDVSTLMMLCSRQAAVISSLSAATTTVRAPLAAARCATRTTIGRPAMSTSGLRGNRVDARRAGMITVKAGTPRSAPREVSPESGTAPGRSVTIAIDRRSGRSNAGYRGRCTGGAYAQSPGHAAGAGSSIRRASVSSITGMPSRIGYARPALRDTSSCLARSYSSGPLVTGQTSMSSSRGSMTHYLGWGAARGFQARLDKINQAGIQSRNERHDTDTPVGGQRRIGAAFYGVLLGDQRPVEGAIGKWIVAVRIVISERDRIEREAGGAQHGEEAIRHADATSGDDAQIAGELFARQLRQRYLQARV